MTEPDKPRPRTRKERIQVIVFGIGVVLMPIGAGMAFVPQQPCSASERETRPAAECSTYEVRRDGAILGGLGLAGVWFGRMSLAARRKSSAWDRSWR